MWNRADLKQYAKQDFQGNYWYCVLVAFLAMVCIGTNELILGILLMNPLLVGARRFFLANIYRDSKGELGDLGHPFKRDYGNVILTMFLKDLFLFLWTCLFVIPGIVKYYSYFMVEYLLADNPSLSRERAFEISKQTMVGEKWNVFVLDLSFILWYIGSACTAGLLGLFYTAPYVSATHSRLYDALKQKAISQGIMTQAELD